MLRPPPFNNVYGNPKWKNDTDHTMPYSYDTHIPLLFYGFPFQPGTYRMKVEPIDMAVTLSSLLGINKPSHAVGRVLTEALAPVNPRAASSPASSGNGEPEKRPERPR